VVILVLLAIGITLAITLPPLLERIANNSLYPPNPEQLPKASPSILGVYQNAGASSDMEICSRIAT